MEPLIPGGVYHIYNHSVGFDLFFANDDNYHHFLKLTKKYLIQYSDILAYCLMPNHFHLVIEIKETKDIISNNSYRTNNEVVNTGLLSRQFGHLFNSYAQAYNKQCHRKGSLFKNRFRRKRIRNENYLKKLIHYVHLNPVEANLCTKPHEWKFSSYNTYIHPLKSSFVKRNYILSLFGGLENFVAVHKMKLNLSSKEKGVLF